MHPVGERKATPAQHNRRTPRLGWAGFVLAGLTLSGTVWGAVPTPVPPAQRGTFDAERSGTHDAANIRTIFKNFGMVGDYPSDPGGVDLTTFHSCEAPKGSGMNYSDGITPFVLAKIRQRNGVESYIMETGFRERQAVSPYAERAMRFEPRPGYFQADPGRNAARSPAISNDPNTWPTTWPDKLDDPDDPGWGGAWNGYFGKHPVADQESYTVMDDQYYDAWDFYPDSRDTTRRGLGLRVEVRGFQWANPQAENVIFWHYDITNEGTTDYDDNIVFGLYMDSGVGGSKLSCDGIYESDDDNAYFNRTFDKDVLNLVYTWDNRGHGVASAGDCVRTGYLGYAYMETPGNSSDGRDNDQDGAIDEKRDGGPGELIEGQDEIRAYVTNPANHFNLARFETAYGPLDKRPAYRARRWWTGDEDMDWTADLHDVGADGVAESGDQGEGDGQPTSGEPNFDKTDLNESDQIGLTGFKLNRIKADDGNPEQETDGILFYTEDSNWPQRLYERFTNADSAARFDRPLATNYNIGFLFASGPFKLKAGKTERFSLALAFGGDLDELRRTTKTVKQIYDANYRFALPPPIPTATAEAGDGYVRLSWSDTSERAADPVTGEFDFEGYRVYRSTDPGFADPRVITNGTGSGTIGNGRPIAQFDVLNDRSGFSTQQEKGVSYYLGNNSGLVHTWTDTTVTNGQQYYYAVTAYDHGSDSLSFYPSENAILVSQRARGGTILPVNVVAVRPEPKVLGFQPARVDTAAHVAGRGSGTVGVAVVNSGLVPEGHLFSLTFRTPSPDSVRAVSYVLRDSTTHEQFFKTGDDFAGEGIGPVGAGLLPIVKSRSVTGIDSARTGFTPESPTNARLTAVYQPLGGTGGLNYRRIGWPDDISVVFSDVVVDTSISLTSHSTTPLPARFRVIAHTPTGDRPLKFGFRDENGDGTLSTATEEINIGGRALADTGRVEAVWRLKLASPLPASLRPPTLGDRYELRLSRPLSVEDIYTFTTHGEHVDANQVSLDFSKVPYVVPNPYIGAASFEPERFGVKGRGLRRIEFRGLPQHCTIRIYTVLGDLVQTLEHDGSTDGMIPWDLRTKDNLDVAPGLYIYHVDGGPLGESTGKFAIIK